MLTHGTYSYRQRACRTSHISSGRFALACRLPPIPDRPAERWPFRRTATCQRRAENLGNGTDSASVDPDIHHLLGVLLRGKDHEIIIRSPDTNPQALLFHITGPPLSPGIDIGPDALLLTRTNELEQFGTYEGHQYSSTTVPVV